MDNKFNIINNVIKDITHLCSELLCVQDISGSLASCSKNVVVVSRTFALNSGMVFSLTVYFKDDDKDRGRLNIDITSVTKKGVLLKTNMLIFSDFDNYLKVNVLKEITHMAESCKEDGDDYGDYLGNIRHSTSYVNELLGTKAV